MSSHAGSLLVARPELDDPHFRRSVVYLLDHNADGAFGVIINRPLVIDVADYLLVPAERVSLPSVFFSGGPVDDESVIALGSDGVEPPRMVDIDALTSGEIAAPLRLRFFAGYAGWSAGQLDIELATDSWFVVPTLRRLDGGDDLFSTTPEQLWRDVLRRQPGSLAALAHFPEDLAAN